MLTLLILVIAQVMFYETYSENIWYYIWFYILINNNQKKSVITRECFTAGEYVWGTSNRGGTINRVVKIHVCEYD